MYKKLDSYLDSFFSIQSKRKVYFVRSLKKMIEQGYEELSLEFEKWQTDKLKIYGLTDNKEFPLTIATCELFWKETVSKNSFFEKVFYPNLNEFFNKGGK